MSSRPIFFVIDPNENRAKETVNRLSNIAKVFMANRSSDLVRVKEKEGRIDAIFVSSEVDHLVNMCKQLTEIISGAKIYVVGNIAPVLIEKLLNVGVVDILKSPIDLQKFKFTNVGVRNNDFVSRGNSTESLNLLDFGQAIPVTTKRIIAVTGSKGGDGKTSTAVQLGMALSKKGLDVLLIDADYTGNAARWLRLDTINSICEFKDRLKAEKYDRDTLEAKLVTHKQTKLKVLPSSVDGISVITTEMLRNAIQAYKPYYSIIILDLHQGYNPLLDISKDFATDILFLAVPEDERLERAKAMAKQISEAGIDQKKVRVIANKIKNEDDIQKIRVTLKNFDFPIYVLPYTKEFMDSNPMPPVFRNKKVLYAKSFQKLISEGLGFKLSSDDVGSEKIKTPKKKKKDQTKDLSTLFSKFKFPFSRNKRKEI